MLYQSIVVNIERVPARESLDEPTPLNRDPGFFAAKRTPKWSGNMERGRKLLPSTFLCASSSSRCRSQGTDMRRAEPVAPQAAGEHPHNAPGPAQRTIPDPDDRAGRLMETTRETKTSSGDWPDLTPPIVQHRPSAESDIKLDRVRQRSVLTSRHCAIRSLRDHGSPISVQVNEERRNVFDRSHVSIPPVNGSRLHMPSNAI